jgi:quinol-cytochrome oxidoreductase complex cytochrome b subunit
VSGTVKRLLGTWRGRVLLLVVVLAVVAAASGALSVVYFRPRAAPAAADGAATAALGFAVNAAWGLKTIHLVAVHALVVALVAWGLLAEAGRRRGLAISALAMVTVAFLITGHLLPWNRLLPWAPRLGQNMARATPVLGQEGPFPELVGVNVRYDDALPTFRGRRLGPRGVRRTFWLHVAVLPGVTLLGLAGARLAARRGAARARAD